MKRLIYIFLLAPILCLGQDIFGTWRTIDDETGEAKSTVKIYEENGIVYGKIIDIYNEADKNALCTKCVGEDYNKPVIGLVIIKNMIKNGENYSNGTIFDPERGKKYKCKLSLNEENSDILQVRGYISVFYATQYWERIN